MNYDMMVWRLLSSEFVTAVQVSRKQHTLSCNGKPKRRIRSGCQVGQAFRRRRQERGTGQGRPIRVSPARMNVGFLEQGEWSWRPDDDVF